MIHVPLNRYNNYTTLDYVSIFKYRSKPRGHNAFVDAAAKQVLTTRPRVAVGATNILDVKFERRGVEIVLYAHSWRTG